MRRRTRRRFDVSEVNCQTQSILYRLQKRLLRVRRVSSSRGVKLGKDLGSREHARVIRYVAAIGLVIELQEDRETQPFLKEVAWVLY